ITNQAELKRCLADYFEHKVLGDATNQVLVEAFTPGEEISVMLLVAGGKYQILPVSRDHKRLLDGNQGPNTGGMGAFAPVKIKASLMKTIESKVIVPTIRGLEEDSLDFRGVLYIGLMVNGNDVSVLEYNVRFGDPE